MNRIEQERLEEIVIKAHYVAMEIRDICASSGIAPPELSLAAAHWLKQWALAFGERLRTLRIGTDGPNDGL